MIIETNCQLQRNVSLSLALMCDAFISFTELENILSADATVDGIIYLYIVETFAFPRLKEKEVQIFRQSEISSCYSNVFRVLLNDTCSGA